MRKAALTVLLLTLLALGAAVSVPSLDAASNCTYYSNAAHTTVVGQYGYDCCNNRVAWGIKTPFSQCGGCFICYPPPPDK
ncbi:MAG TPA: DUF6289 family protein [Thermoanaerobaculia bacterium]|nr:DUF6289 family protein [Thermoanaerobaculia bacterium]